jgi:hypothetical protein
MMAVNRRLQELNVVVNVPDLALQLRVLALQDTHPLSIERNLILRRKCRGPHPVRWIERMRVKAADLRDRPQNSVARHHVRPIGHEITSNYELFDSNACWGVMPIDIF